MMKKGRTVGALLRDKLKEVEREKLERAGIKTKWIHG